jgi:hypothetical protein
MLKCGIWPQRFGKMSLHGDNSWTSIHWRALPPTPLSSPGINAPLHADVGAGLRYNDGEHGGVGGGLYAGDSHFLNTASALDTASIGYRRIGSSMQHSS